MVEEVGNCKRSLSGKDCFKTTMGNTGWEWFAYWDRHSFRKHLGHTFETREGTHVFGTTLGRTLGACLRIPFFWGMAWDKGWEHCDF